VHALLKTQIERFFGKDVVLSHEMQQLLQAVEASYDQFDKEIALANEKLEIANRRKREFLANMSHELRTPLNAIIGYSEMLQDELKEKGNLQAMQDDIQKIYHAGKNLLSMIDEILQLTRIEAGKFELSIREIKLRDFIDEIVLASRHWIESKKNVFELEMTSEIATIETDESKLRQILLNLLNNAGKFTLNGRVKLSIIPHKIKEEDWIAFHVYDTGRGIPAENLPSIFEYFTHIEDSTSKLEGGAGIGLATSERFCKLLGGEFKVESELGKGSTFTVLLPKHFLANKGQKSASE
jgi:signal transduction histidine kinase